MKLSEFKNELENSGELRFLLPDGNPVPAHFHLTEAGLTTKNFIDCGGTVREEKVVNFQLFLASDFDHRLSTEKLLKIISLSEKILPLADHEIEIEYETDTIGRYGLGFKDAAFRLLKKQTDCLAKDNCGVPAEKKKISSNELATEEKSCCSPSSGCCN
jgi:hypothetical protein